MITKIISGGQTGADRGGLDAAIWLGISRGGWCPKGRRAEDGVVPAFYNLQETASSGYVERTGKNVMDSDATILFANSKASPGSALTQVICQRLGKPILVVSALIRPPDDGAEAQAVAEFLDRHKVQVVNVAGHRESVMPGLQSWVRRVMVEAVRIMRERMGEAQK